jgi:hypothetical protein
MLKSLNRLHHEFKMERECGGWRIHMNRPLYISSRMVKQLGKEIELHLIESSNKKKILQTDYDLGYRYISYDKNVLSHWVWHRDWIDYFIEDNFIKEAEFLL